MEMDADIAAISRMNSVFGDVTRTLAGKLRVPGPNATGSDR